jgi:hypothetical protein
MRCFITFNCWGWAYGCTFTPLPPQTFPGLGELAEAEILGDASLQTMPLRSGWGCRTFQTASQIHVIQIWCVWAPSTVVYRHMAAHSLRYYHRRFPRLGELAESLGDVSVQTVPLRNGWGCRTFQTAYHIHVIPIYGVWAPSTVGDGHMAAHSLRYHHRRSLVWESWLKS